MDLEWVDRALQGDTEAFSKLVEKYQKPVYFTAMRILSDHEEAADIAQQTFVNAFRSLSTFRRESSFKTWAYQIAINLCRNRIKERTRLPDMLDITEIEVIDSERLPLDSLDERERAKQIQQAVQRLPDQQRMTLVLRVYEGYSYEQIADLLGCAQETARANYHHGVRSLRKMLEGVE